MTHLMGRRLLFPVVALAAVACNASAPSSGANTRLILSVRTSDVVAAAPVAAPETITVGSDVLVLNQVDLVIREIQLNRVGRTNGCDTDSEGGDNPGNQEDADQKDGPNEDVGDDCEQVEMGPMLVSLPLGGVTSQKIAVTLASGIYDRVEFEIHKPDVGDARDGTFLTTNPDFRGISIRARGTFNGAPFEYLTDLSATQELTLSPPLVLTAGGTAELTLTINVRGWFLDQAGTKLVNPATALKGQPNEGLVKGNIKKSIGAEGDDDKDN